MAGGVGVVAIVTLLFCFTLSGAPEAQNAFVLKEPPVALPPVAEGSLTIHFDSLPNENMSAIVKVLGDQLQSKSRRAEAVNGKTKLGFQVTSDFAEIVETLKNDSNYKLVEAVPEQKMIRLEATPQLMVKLAEATAIEQQKELERENLFKMHDVPSPGNEVVEVFNSYRLALLDKDGAKAVSLVDAATIALYEKDRLLALTGTKEELLQLPMMKLMQVLMYRQRMSAEELKTMDGASIFHHGIEQGWIAADTVKNLSTHSSTVILNQAKVGISVNGRPSGYSYSFNREGGQWKFNPVGVMDIVQKSLATLAEQQGLSETDFVCQVVEFVTNQPVTEETWKPIIE